MSLPSNIEYPNPNDFAGFLMWQKSNSWEKYVNLELKKIGLNQAEYFLLVSLFYLINKQKEVTQVELAEFAGTTAMNASKIVNKFEENSIITRKTGKDSRSKALLITEKGKNILITAATSMGEADSIFFPEANKSGFISYLKNIE